MNSKEDLIDEVELEVEDEKDRKRVKNELKKVETAISEIEAAGGGKGGG